ncbi:MAG: hypothetical protein LBD38_01360 [Streptococcaceae bacterium]|jgi:hypothetical protein|nr:hypothetical protein [Streptococcaceae bacterium]
MKKILLLLCFQLLAGCSPQKKFNFSLSLHNPCDIPIQIVSYHHTNNTNKPSETVITQQLDVDKSLPVFEVCGFSNSKYSVPSLYKLEVYAGGKKTEFDRNYFLEELENSMIGHSSGVCLTISNSSLCPESQEEIAEKAMEELKKRREAFRNYYGILMAMAYARKYGMPDDINRVIVMEYILDEINENNELIDLVVDALWLMEEGKRDESLAAFDEIYKRYSKDKRAIVRDVAAITRLNKLEDMQRNGRTANAQQSIIDELGKEFDMNDPGIQMLLELVKTR